VGRGKEVWRAHTSVVGVCACGPEDEHSCLRCRVNGIDPKSHPEPTICRMTLAPRDVPQRASRDDKNDDRLPLCEQVTWLLLCQEVSLGRLMRAEVAIISLQMNISRNRRINLREEPTPFDNQFLAVFLRIGIDGTLTL